jgi:hypothetical protein
MFYHLFFSLQKSLPAGKAFVATGAQQIPAILQKIFASTIVADN